MVIISHLGPIRKQTKRPSSLPSETSSVAPSAGEGINNNLIFNSHLVFLIFIFRVSYSIESFELE